MNKYHVTPEEVVRAIGRVTDGVIGWVTDGVTDGVIV